MTSDRVRKEHMYDKDRAEDKMESTDKSGKYRMDGCRGMKKGNWKRMAKRRINKNCGKGYWKNEKLDGKDGAKIEWMSWAEVVKREWAKETEVALFPTHIHSYIKNAPIVLSALH